MKAGAFSIPGSGWDEGRARLNELPRLARKGGAHHRGTAALRAERLGT